MLMLLLPCVLWAQEATQESEFTMSAQLRARGEYRNGALYPRSEGELPATFINDRARLSHPDVPSLEFQKPYHYRRMTGVQKGKNLNIIYTYSLQHFL